MTMSTTVIRTPFTLLLALFFLGCVSKESVLLPAKLDLPQKPALAHEALTAPGRGATHPVVEKMPAAPQTAPILGSQPLPKPTPGKQKDKLNLNFEQVPLTTLIQVVYSEILGRSVNIDPAVMERRDLVTFRTPAQQTSAQIASAMQLLLKSYGLAAMDIGDLVRVVPDTAQIGHLPELRRGVALPETPEVLRPIFQLLELQAVRNSEVAGWIKNMFGERVQVQEDATRNALLLSGTSDNVAAAIEAVRVLDQPLMRGRASLRITPMFSAAEELSKRLLEILAAEGYSMPPDTHSVIAGGMRYPILLLPLPESNTLLVFAMSDEILAHVQEWVNKLDHPNEQTRGSRTFTYTAQNTSAESLAETMTQMFQGAAAATPAKAAGGTTEAPGAAAKATPANNGRVVVDKTSNTLIFQAEPAEFSQLLGLLRTLDKPSKSALIEVTVAEVTLTDNSQLGIEWLLKDISSGGAEVIAKTMGGLSLGNKGFNISGLSSNGDAKVFLNALASSNRASILSSPRIMARNGQTAMIQVGQEVPIITSQQSTVSAATTDGTGVLQTVQYRNTGVILTVKPVIHSGNRIDLEIQQEVSAAQSTETGVNNSPTIATRKVQTNMTLLNGATVLLGGLISKDKSNGNAGIPGLKDIPVLGSLFRVESQKDTKTELIVLITPYILDNDHDAQAVTEAFKEMLPSLAEGNSEAAATLPYAPNPLPPASKQHPKSEPLVTP
jgi:general secretion pathway protein D